MVTSPGRRSACLTLSLPDRAMPQLANSSWSKHTLLAHTRHPHQGLSNAGAVGRLQSLGQGSSLGIGGGPGHRLLSLPSYISSGLLGSTWQEPEAPNPTLARLAHADGDGAHPRSLPSLNVEVNGGLQTVCPPPHTRLHLETNTATSTRDR